MQAGFYSELAAIRRIERAAERFLAELESHLRVAEVHARQALECLQAAGFALER